MMLNDINKKWISYKQVYNLDSPVLVEELRFDAEEGTDSSFDITEMFSHHYVLHLNPKVHLYRSDYVDIVLWHEFTHLYDFLNQPFAYKVMRKIYLYMNTFSEYHASRRTIERTISLACPGEINPDKCLIPTAYKEISIRELVNNTLKHAELSQSWFKKHPSHQSFHIYLRYVMYLMGYASIFENKKDILRFCLTDLKESEELYLELFDIMEDKDFFKIVSHMDAIYEEAGL